MNPDRKLLITGANGFIGRHLRAYLLRVGGYQVIAGVREPVSDDETLVSEALNIEQWCERLKDIDTVVHAAARAHILPKDEPSAGHLYEQINVAMTRNLALAAVSSGVRRFIFISSIGVNGAFSKTPFTETDEPAPCSDYARSKYRAEHVLWELAANSAMEIVILRLPLVYGPGVKANFQSMLRWVDSCFPLPLRSVVNKRSLLGVDNLVNFVELAINHPAAANELFLVADGEDISTPELLKTLASGLGRRSLLFALPKNLLLFAAKAVGKKSLVNKVCGSLQVDINKAQSYLSWTPTTTVKQGLIHTAEAYRRNRDTYTRKRAQR